MTELKELFDMVTKQKVPELGSWEEQERRQRRATRNRKLGAFVASAAVIVAGVVTFAALRDEGQGGAAPISQPTASPTGAGNTRSHYYVDLATGERTTVSVNLSAASFAEVSPNGQAIVYGPCCSNPDPLYVAALDGSSDPVRITPDGLSGYAANWIDDETILFQGRDASTRQLGDLYTVDVATGEMTTVTDLPDERNGAWIVRSDLSPDGTTILFHLPRGKGNGATWDLWTAPLAGGERSLLRQDAGFATYSPDGSIVFLDQPYPFGGDEVWIMEGDGTSARSIASGSSFAFPEVSPDGTRVLVGIDAGPPTIVDIATGEVTTIDAAAGSESPSWYDDDTLIVEY